MTIRLLGAKPNYVRAAVAAILGSAAVALPAWAADDTALEEVQVTGTRIQQRGEYVSPTPMATFSSADLEKLGIVNVSDAMTQIPQNVSQFTPANTGGSAFFIGSTLANLRGLNPFFGTRTLTLVDSRRFIPTTQGDAVDLNFIPSNMIQRMEVVTGGASAAYGSGAISGVVNVILDKSLRGIKIDADYGVSGEGDADSYHVGLAGGLDFAGGRGSIILGGEWQKNEVVQSCADARDWCARGRGFYNNINGFPFVPVGVPFAPRIPGQPHFIIMDGLHVNQISANGVIYSNSPTATQTSQFNDAGTGVTPWNLGQYGNFGPGGFAQGGDGDRAYTNLTLYPDVERITTFSHAEFQFTDRVTGYAELSYGQVKAENLQAETAQVSANNCIRPDNAFLSTLNAEAQAALAANFGNDFDFGGNIPCADFSLGFPMPGGTVVSKSWYPQVPQVVSTDTKVLRGVVGAKGNFLDTWTWDAYYQYGKTERDQIGSNYRTSWRYAMAVDSVIDPVTNQPACRVTVTGVLPNPGVDPSLAQGCQPLNIFGQAASPQALAYAFGNLTESNVIRQDVFAVSTTGQLWDGWGAGPLAAAVGAEYRKESLTNDAGDLPFAQRTDFGLQYGDSFEGDTEVKEAFLELEMPLLRDLPGAQLVTLNGAVRWANYKTEGGMGTIGGTNSQDITTWKVAAVWDPIDWLRFRGSYSSDIRAAGFRELFYSQSIPPGPPFGSVQNPWIVPDPSINLTNTDNSALILRGNPSIEPEEAKTKTVGIVLTPGGVLNRMQISVDYYDIELEGGMSLEQAQLNVNDCFDGVRPEACDLLVFGPPLAGQTGPNAQFSNIIETWALYRNLNTYSTKGIDFAVDYTLPMEAIPGTFMFRLSGSYTIETIIPSGVDVAGQVGADSGFLSDFAPSPDFSGNLAVTYVNGPFAGTIQARYVAGGRLDLQNPKTGPGDPGFDPTLSFSVTDGDIGSYVTWNLNASYDLGLWGAERTEVFLSVNNLFDRDPPFAAGTFGGFGGTNPIFYDTLGRYFRVGARVKF